MKYYLKRLVRNRVHVDGSRDAIPFLRLGDGSGILATQNQKEIEFLEKRIEDRRGGILAITAEQFEELKKKRIPVELLSRRRPPYDFSGPPRASLNPSAVVAAAAEPPASQAQAAQVKQEPKTAVKQVPKIAPPPNVGRPPAPTGNDE